MKGPFFAGALVRQGIQPRHDNKALRQSIQTHYGVSYYEGELVSDYVLRIPPPKKTNPDGTEWPFARIHALPGVHRMIRW